MASGNSIFDSIVNEATQFRDTGFYDLFLIVVTGITTSVFSCKIWSKKLSVATNEWQYHGEEKREQSTHFRLEFKVHISNNSNTPIQLNVRDKIKFYGPYFQRDEKILHLHQKDKILTIAGYESEVVVLNSLSSIRHPTKVKLFFNRNGNDKSYICKIPFIDTNIPSLFLESSDL